MKNYLIIFLSIILNINILHATENKENILLKPVEFINNPIISSKKNVILRFFSPHVATKLPADLVIEITLQQKEFYPNEHGIINVYSMPKEKKEYLGSFSFYLPQKKNKVTTFLVKVPEKQFNKSYFDIEICFDLINTSQKNWKTIFQVLDAKLIW